MVCVCVCVHVRVVGRYGAILADEMGLGKTLQSVALAWTLLKQGPYGGKPIAKRILVVTPGSLVQNWGAEFNKWLGRERISVFTVDQVREEAGGFSLVPFYCPITLTLILLWSETNRPQDQVLLIILLWAVK